ncbi:cyclic pyranopterin monophosphate synthase MoaC [Nesterenkonia marinintestina]|uniref:cyclic pyranopterin monophosphate synthase MoaC n=1 Tax=Nesterenkonia marinintestina TaxID=2979865 RepID=UPI0021C21B1D|nr:cyclic pyranopterin monophosphate synthase MoaC [Nesterenkonia sp. GX14115]
MSTTEDAVPPRHAGLTHVREDGSAHMVDVGDKDVTARRAAAESTLHTRPDVVAQILTGGLPKGDALAVARVAGIMGAKRTPELVPLCHPLPISGVTVDFAPAGPEQEPDAVRISAEVRTTGRTGVEMEALTAASVAALTLYDMIKALDRAAEITATRVVTKSGGASGDWSRG